MALPILDGNQTAATLSTIITGGAHIPAHTVVSLGSQAISDISNAVSSVQVSGTVTAYLPPAEAWAGIYDNGNDCIKVELANLNGDTPSPSNPLPIAGTVTANLFGEAVGGGPNEPTKLQCDSNGFLITSLYRSGSDAVNYDPVAGNVSVNVKNISSITVSALPSGALTTRFGSVTTANTAQITSAVTNTSRKYLLAQNISAGTVTIGIGFSPTTTQGIQLAAGGGLTFDAFCPTGAVYWLGAVTGAAYTILEG